MITKELANYTAETIIQCVVNCATFYAFERINAKFQQKAGNKKFYFYRIEDEISTRVDNLKLEWESHVRALTYMCPALKKLQKKLSNFVNINLTEESLTTLHAEIVEALLENQDQTN